jgi:hypothetical protein
LDFAAEVGNADECRAAFGALAQLESLCLEDINGVNRLLPHLAVAPALRTLTVACGASNPATTDARKSALPSREAMRRLLAAAPRLKVRLHAPSLDRWRMALWYFGNDDAAQTEQMDEQWHELQRMGADLERVTAVAVEEDD